MEAMIITINVLIMLLHLILSYLSWAYILNNNDLKIVWLLEILNQDGILKVFICQLRW